MSSAVIVCSERRIICIYVPILVAFNEATYSPALSEAVVFHAFIFPVLQNVFRPQDVPDYSHCIHLWSRYGISDGVTERLIVDCFSRLSPNISAKLRLREF